MWPSEYTFYLLVLGLLPLLYVSFSAIRFGFAEALSLRFAGILFFWIGYHLSPWLAYFSNDTWKSFLLVPALIDSGLLFSSLCMFSFLIGYDWMMQHGRFRQSHHIFSRLEFPQINPKWLAIFAVLSLIIFVISVGGFDEVWVASRSRGEDHFKQRDLAGKMFQILNVLASPLYIALMCMAVLFILKKTASLSQVLFGSLCLLIASLSSFWHFSRGAGFGFIILAFLALRLNGRRSIPLAMVALIVGIYLGSTGINQRGYYNPGLGNFLYATLTTITPSNEEQQKKPFLSPESNSLDTMAAWTRKVDAIYIENPSIYEMAPRFFWNLNPFPSEIVPLMPTGEGLATIMGTIGSTGITTPAFGEIYYVFGPAGGAILVIIFGVIYAWFEKLTITRPGMVTSICLLLCFISLPLGLHSSTRAMTRPLLYAFVLYMIVTHFFSRNKVTSNKITTSKDSPYV